jgi:hypothetical protein
LCVDEEVDDEEEKEEEKKNQFSLFLSLHWTEGEIIKSFLNLFPI